MWLAARQARRWRFSPGAVDAGDIAQLTRFGTIRSPPAWSPDGRWISFRYTDERNWSNAARIKKIYAEHPGDKRAVWIVRPDGSDAQLVEATRFGCAMDRSRAQWRPRQQNENQP
jgi:Tol biopolymer transport system component